MINCTITNKPNSVKQFTWPSQLPRKVKDYDSRNMDPYHRLLLAVAARAVIDLIWPTLKLEPDERAEALQFVIDHRDLYLDHGVPEWKYNALVRYAIEA